jgi:hypothetical protein
MGPKPIYEPRPASIDLHNHAPHNGVPIAHGRLDYTASRYPVTRRQQSNLLASAVSAILLRRKAFKGALVCFPFKPDRQNIVRRRNVVRNRQIELRRDRNMVLPRAISSSDVVASVTA